MTRGHTTTIAIALSCSVFLVHTLIGLMVGDLSSTKQWLQITVTTLASAAIISFATKGVTAALSNMTWLFKLVMGNQYIRGTWAGIIITKSGARLLFVEHYDQTTMGLTIRGWSFRSLEPEYDARWTTQCVTLNPEQGLMNCLYETHVRTSDGRENDVRFGTGRFRFMSHESNGAAKRLQGIGVDEYHTEHLTYKTVERLDHKLLDVDVAFKLALDKFGASEPENVDK